MSFQSNKNKTFQKKTLSAFSTDATTSKKRKISEDEDLKEKITPITDFEDDRSRSSDSKREKKISRRSKHSSNNDKMSIDDGNGDDGLIAKELSIGYLRDRITNTGHHQYQLESNKEQVSALETFKNQIQSCPDEKEIDYESINVEEYGLNMLKNMGWKPGMAIGRNQNVKLKDIQEPKPRPTHLGLGANILPTKKKT
ncbi:7751_t:CDS:2 [Entrophospora sp. SA101]|nr:6316_t:CDS:2 [Entrophospora sp. SA101]CAJ0629069.1 7751_t:CDS:2 [Entrophospora sp. SA101]CAJ0829822.1 6926_t:CDS:2 [Entrophospora sp. SA101]CAJ0836761.1 3262_t:CDS:2 [Entrophospora sp. SA101]